MHLDEGIVGWGEGYTQTDRDGAMLRHMTAMGRHLVGRTFAIKHFTSVMYDDYALRRPGMDFWSALSGLEQPLHAWRCRGAATADSALRRRGALAPNRRHG